MAGYGEVNVRDGPGTEFDRIARLSGGNPVDVTGQVRGTNWYRIRLNDGETAYIYSKLLRGDEREAPAQRATVQPPGNNSASAMQHIQRGENFFKSGQYQAALSEFNRAIKLAPANSRAFNNRGYTYYTLRQYRPAIRDLSKSIRLNPNNAMAYNNRGNIHFLANHFDQAISDYQNAIRLDPNNPFAHQGLQQALQAQANQ